MRVSLLAIAVALLGFVPAGSALAQNRTTTGLRQPASVTRTAYEYDNYYAEAESEAEGQTESAEGESSSLSVSHRLERAAGCSDSCADDCCDACGDACGGCCGGGGGGAGAAADGPARLFENFTPLGTNFYGWTSTYFVWNWSNPADNFNGPVTWPDRANELNLGELYMIAERPTDTGGYGFDMGYRVDTAYGTYSRFYTSAGLEDRINKSQSFYGLALPNLYAQAHLNNTTVKLGHFTSPVGYFAVGTYNNFFNVLPYTFQYGEPFTHTGFLAQRPVGEKLSVGGGLTRGWDNSGSFNPHLGAIGLVSLTGPNDGNLTWFGSFGQEPNFGPTRPNTNGEPGFSFRYLQSLVWMRQLNDSWNLVLQSDLGYQNDALADGNDAYWYGANSYLFYKWSCRTDWGVNMEWFRDEDGFRVGGFLPNFANNTNGGPTETRGLAVARGGYAGDFYRFMIGPRWRYTENIIIRPALALDWFDGVATNPGGLKPYDDGNSNHQGILATDVLIVF